MNLNNLVLENIVQSAYYKNYLIEITTFQQAVEEVLHNVSIFGVIVTVSFRWNILNRGSGGPERHLDLECAARSGE